jgi:trimeric autotransporter adhesin
VVIELAEIAGLAREAECTVPATVLALLLQDMDMCAELTAVRAAVAGGGSSNVVEYERDESDGSRQFLVPAAVSDVLPASPITAAAATTAAATARTSISASRAAAAAAAAAAAVAAVAPEAAIVVMGLQREQWSVTYSSALGHALATWVQAPKDSGWHISGRRLLYGCDNAAAVPGLFARLQTVMARRYGGAVSVPDCAQLSATLEGMVVLVQTTWLRKPPLSDTTTAGATDTCPTAAGSANGVAAAAFHSNTSSSSSTEAACYCCCIDIIVAATLSSAALIAELLELKRCALAVLSLFPTLNPSERVLSAASLRSGAAPDDRLSKQLSDVLDSAQTSSGVSDCCIAADDDAVLTTTTDGSAANAAVNKHAAVYLVSPAEAGLASTAATAAATAAAATGGSDVSSGKDASVLSRSGSALSSSTTSKSTGRADSSTVAAAVKAERNNSTSPNVSSNPFSFALSPPPPAAAAAPAVTAAVNAIGFTGAVRKTLAATQPQQQQSAVKAASSDVHATGATSRNPFLKVNPFHEPAAHSDTDDDGESVGVSEQQQQQQQQQQVERDHTAAEQLTAVAMLAEDAETGSARATGPPLTDGDSITTSSPIASGATAADAAGATAADAAGATAAAAVQCVYDDDFLSDAAVMFEPALSGRVYTWSEQRFELLLLSPGGLQLQCYEADGYATGLAAAHSPKQSSSSSGSSSSSKSPRPTVVHTLAQVQRVEDERLASSFNLGRSSVEFAVTGAVIAGVSRTPWHYSIAACTTADTNGTSTIAAATAAASCTGGSGQLMSYDEVVAALNPAAASTVYPLFVQLIAAPPPAVKEEAATSANTSAAAAKSASRKHHQQQAAAAAAHQAAALPVPAPAQLVCVVVGTNRARQRDATGDVIYGCELSASSDVEWCLATIAYAAALPELGDSMFVDTHEYALVGAYALSKAAALSLVKGHPAQRALVYVHGFNNNLAHAARTAGLFSRCLHMPLMILLTWPSDPSSQGRGWLIEKVSTVYIYYILYVGNSCLRCSTVYTTVGCLQW